MENSASQLTLGRAAPREARTRWCPVWLVLLWLACPAGGCFRLGLRSVEDDAGTPPGDAEADDAGADAEDADALDGDSGDDGVRDAETGDADAAPLGGCAFIVDSVSPIEPLDDGLATNYEPTLTGDLLELYFASFERPGGAGREDLWVSTRADPTGEWGEPRLVSELSTSDREGSPAVALDGLTMVFGSNRSLDASGWDIWISTRPDRLSPWGDPEHVDELSSTEDELPSWVSDDGLTLAGHLNRGGVTSLYLATRPTVTDPWSPWTPIDEVDTDAFESSAFVGDGGRSMMFDSDRLPSAGWLDLYLASRSGPSGPFTSVLPLSALNGPSNDADPWFTEVPCMIVFARSTGTPTSIYSGPAVLYEARCDCE